MNAQGRPVLLLAYFRWDEADWWEALAPAAEMAELRRWPDAGDPAEIDYVVAWRQQNGFLAQFPNLRAIFSIGAGVEKLLQDPDLPDVPIVRMIDDSLKLGMTEYVVERVLHHHRLFPTYEANQRARRWTPLGAPLAREKRVLVLGMGEIGGHCAWSLAAMGFQVRGWSRSGRAPHGVEPVTGPLEGLVGEADYVVAILPLTGQTHGILNAGLFSHMRGAYLINVGRGAHLVEDDLIPALDAGRLAGAALDVFAVEPLPPDHPFWTDPRITVTPHDSAITLPRSAAPRIVENLRRILSGEEPVGLVDRRRGY